MKDELIELQNQENSIKGNIKDLESQFYSNYYEAKGFLQKSGIELGKDVILSELGAPNLEGQTGYGVLNDVLPEIKTYVDNKKQIITQIGTELENLKAASFQRMTVEETYSKQVKYRMENNG